MTNINRYSAETIQITSKTKRLLETADMKILTRNRGNTLKDRIMSDELRWKRSIGDLNKWTLNRKWERNNHTTRMTETAEWLR